MARDEQQAQTMRAALLLALEVSEAPGWVVAGVGSGYTFLRPDIAHVVVMAYYQPIPSKAFYLADKEHWHLVRAAVTRAVSEHNERKTGDGA